MAPPPAQIDLSAPVKQGAAAAEASNTPLTDAEQTAGTLDDSPAKARMVASLQRVRSWWQLNLVAWHDLVAQSQRQVEASASMQQGIKDRDTRIATLDKTAQGNAVEIAKLKAADPTVTRLNLVGVGMLVLAVGMLGVGIWLNILWVRSASLVMGGMGLAVLTLARYLHTLQWIVGSLAVVAALGVVVYLIVHRRAVGQQLKAINLLPQGVGG